MDIIEKINELLLERDVKNAEDIKRLKTVIDEYDGKVLLDGKEYTAKVSDSGKTLKMIRKGGYTRTINFEDIKNYEIKSGVVHINLD